MAPLLLWYVSIYPDIWLRVLLLRPIRIYSTGCFFTELTTFLDNNSEDLILTRAFKLFSQWKLHPHFCKTDLFSQKMYSGRFFSVHPSQPTFPEPGIVLWRRRWNSSYIITVCKIRPLFWDPCWRFLPTGIRNTAAEFSCRWRCKKIPNRNVMRLFHF